MIVEMLSQTSHELRTPLAVIRGSISLVLHRWDALGEEERRELLAMASMKADELIAVVSRLESTRDT
jgi:K+-sensing histidine kinase KdpD